MMKKMLKAVEIGYIVVALISAFQIISTWGEFGMQFWFFAAALVLSTLMVFVRRSQRHRYERYLEEQKRKEQEELN